MNPFPIILAGAPIGNSASSPDATWGKIVAPPSYGSELVLTCDGVSTTVSIYEDIGDGSGSSITLLHAALVVTAGAVSTPTGVVGVSVAVWVKVTSTSGSPTTLRGAFTPAGWTP